MSLYECPQCHEQSIARRVFFDTWADFDPDEAEEYGPESASPLNHGDETESWLRNDETVCTNCGFGCDGFTSDWWTDGKLTDKGQKEFQEEVLQ